MESNEMSHVVKLALDDQEMLERAADILCELGGLQSRIDGTPWSTPAREAISRAEKELMEVIRTHGETR